MLIIIRRKVLIASLIVLIFGIILIFNYGAVVNTFHTKYLSVVVIDPGHGGIDGGTSSADGVIESHINLEIAFKLRKIFVENGWKVVMTREEDIGLYSESGSVRSKKMQDLVNRKKIIEKTEPDYVFMIHLNSFPQASCFGAQTFYPSKSQESKMLSIEVQKALVEGIDNGNRRKSKAKNDIYLLKNVTVPTVLVECGFLSNTKEAKLLQKDEYQKKLAECIYEGLLNYCELTSNPPKESIDYVIDKNK